MNPVDMNQVDVARSGFLLQPRIFREFPEIASGMTMRLPKLGGYGFNLSNAVGDDSSIVESNRTRVAEALGFRRERLALQRQVHGTTVSRVAEGYEPTQSDALVTDEPGWLLGISIADCVPVLIYDARSRIVSGVHSGWRGTEQRVLPTTLEYMRRTFSSDPADLFLFIGPAASACCYEVGPEVAERFHERYSRATGPGKYHLDNKGGVLDQALEWGVDPSNIELDPRCTICDESFHSFRRDGSGSGRMLALIGLKGGAGLV